MIIADLHNHTCFSHGKNTPLEMHMEASKKGIKIFGLSEHSPRPKGFNYKNEYREKLAACFADYIKQTNNLKKICNSGAVLLGMEIDWIENQENFIKETLQGYNFDCITGSVHFIEKWGFDEDAGIWNSLSQKDAEKFYVQYFLAWQKMIKSGLFHIAAHPDLIKIFSKEKFDAWLQKTEAKELVKNSLLLLKKQNMLMEISSAGLRKPCAEIYPNPAICKMAKDIQIDICFASDAHNTADTANNFAELEKYAKSFGFNRYGAFINQKKVFFDFYGNAAY